jgi:hypothetical protein
LSRHAKVLPFSEDDKHKEYPLHTKTCGAQILVQRVRDHKAGKLKERQLPKKSLLRTQTHLEDQVITCKSLNREMKFAHKFNTWWEVGTVKRVDKGGEFEVFYESDSQVCKQELNEDFYGVDKSWVLFPEKNKYLIVKQTSHAACKHHNIPSK